MRRNIVIHEFTLKLLYFETAILEPVTLKEIAAFKSQLLALFRLNLISTMNGAIMVWSTLQELIIQLRLPYCLPLTTGMFEMDKIYLWPIHQVHQMSLEILPWELG